MLGFKGQTKILICFCQIKLCFFSLYNKIPAKETVSYLFGFLGRGVIFCFLFHFECCFWGSFVFFICLFLPCSPESSARIPTPEKPTPNKPINPART